MPAGTAPPVRRFVLRSRSSPPLRSADDGGPAVELVLDAICDCCGIVVLPRAEDPPALSRQDRLVPGVALPVRQQLPSPQLGVGLRELHVLLAVVPEAAVDEDRDPGAWEHEVGADTAPAAHLPVDEEPTATAVQLPAQCELGCRVTPAEAGHVATACVVGFPLLHHSSLSCRGVIAVADDDDVGEVCRLPAVQERPKPLLTPVARAARTPSTARAAAPPTTP